MNISRPQYQSMERAIAGLIGQHRLSQNRIKALEKRCETLEAALLDVARSRPPAARSRISA